MTVLDKTRRKRKRKPTISPRFGDSSIAFEIALVRMALKQKETLYKKQIKVAGK